jgi:hypothetical protein
LIIRAEPLFKPEMVKIHLTKRIATLGEMVHIEIMLNSGLERVRLSAQHVYINLM